MTEPDVAQQNTVRSGAGLRWGLLGASRIAGRRFIPALRETGGSIVAVAASSADRAADFAREHGIERSYGGYAALLNDPDVDAVYLSLASAQHLDWLLETGRAGKPCLCEKPLALHGKDAAELHRLFTGSGLRLAEAFMWRHHPQIDYALQRIVAGDVGDLERVNATFSFTLDRAEDYRWSAALGGGALYDLGSYAVNAARLFFSSEPLAMSARAHWGPGPDAVDHTAAGWLDFGAGRLATFNCSFTSGFAQGLELVGSKARLWLGRPWNNVDRETHVVLDDGMKKSRHRIEPVNHYALMIRHFTAAVLDPASPLFPAEYGLAQARVMESLAASASRHGEATPADSGR